MSSSSVLENAGITNGQVTNSDKYMAIRLTREFDNALDRFSLKNVSELDKNQAFDLLVELLLLKSIG